MNFSSMVTSISAQNFAQAKQKFSGDIANYYKSTYFSRSNYLKIGEKPVVVIYNNSAAFKVANNDVSKVSSALTAFEQTVGQEVYWIYAASSPTESSYEHYKQMGYDALFPYGMLPDINYDVNPQATLDHSESLAIQLEKVEQMYQKATAANIKYIPAIVPNFDEQNIYLTNSGFLSDLTRYTY
ncbi:MAG: hypothetical protein Q9M91_06070 [Candidatus Dojkabacteria bacterium]|nr:hypothetical protein [Candidatus Dojkabacteria bacterium]